MEVGVREDDETVETGLRCGMLVEALRFGGVEVEVDVVSWKSGETGLGFEREGARVWKLVWWEV